MLSHCAQRLPDAALASKPIAVVACVDGLDSPPDLHRPARQDLRARASYLDDHPSVAADFELASVVERRSDSDRRAVGKRAAGQDRLSMAASTPICGAIR